MLKSLISRHAEDAAFYWARSSEGSLSGQHDVRSLRRFAGILEGNLEGLRVAQLEGRITVGQANQTVQANPQLGWQATWSRLSRWKTADESFASSVIALEAAAQDASLLSKVEELACDQYDDSQGQDLDVARGLASAAAWLPWPVVQGAVMRWAQSKEPVLKRCSMSACALQRLPDSTSLGAWLDDPHAIVRERALKAVGELGRGDLQATLIAHLAMPNDAVLAANEPPSQEQFWAAWSLCMLGRTEGVDTLVGWVDHPKNQDKSLASRRMQAIAAASQVMPSHALDALIIRWFEQTPFAADSLPAKQRNSQRHALAAVRFSGDLRWLNTLLDLIVRETQTEAIEKWFTAPGSNLARSAADVYAHLTGAVIGESLWMHAPEPAEESEADHNHPHAHDLESNPAIPLSHKHDPDDGLLWPQPEAMKAWHAQHVASFAQLAEAGVTVVRGQDLNLQNAHQLIDDPLAGQLQRYHTALFLQAGQHTTTLIDVRVLNSSSPAAISMAKTPTMLPKSAWTSWSPSASATGPRPPGPM